ncbi:MAG: hypothetical protein Q8P59_09055 [Dehalococcoidia bacterium]|nr:hypothetical protein [Dehalococcoidia bacterium]
MTRAYGKMLTVVSCLPRGLGTVWATALAHASRDERVSKDVQVARERDPASVTRTDFLRECAWAIFGGGVRFQTLMPKWPHLEKAFRQWDVERVMAEAADVRAEVLGIWNHRGKVEAVLAIASKVSGDGWSEVATRFVDGLESDVRGNLRLSRDLICYLDGFPWVGPTLAAYIAKNLGAASIKPDIWMRRLALWLGYQGDPVGVWQMALDIQALTGEKINVVDTVLWNWARVQPCLRQAAS